jgi:hypothetical protein
MTACILCGGEADTFSVDINEATTLNLQVSSVCWRCVRDLLNRHFESLYPAAEEAKPVGKLRNWRMQS